MDTQTVIDVLGAEGVPTTENITEAIYITADGQLISGNFVDGCRTEDHRCVELLFDDTDRYDTHFWDIVAERTGLIMYVPETQMILLKPQHTPTPQQQDLIDGCGLEIEYF